LLHLADYKHDVEVNTEKTKHIVMFRHKSA